MVNGKRLVVLFTFTLIGIVYFWFGSRYPDLDAKALMAHSASVADTLSPWPLFEVSPNDSFISRTFFSTLNWVNSNLKGMAFGLCLGAAFLTLFSYISLSNKPGRFRNTLYGFLLGTPLSVCVNCAAPVFKGILESKRLELAMSTMLSSPTMNIIVLTMVFSLFPFYMGIVKVLFTLICIFVGIPLISKFLKHDNDTQIPLKTDLAFVSGNPVCAPKTNESWTVAFVETLKDYAIKLRFMSIRLIPLMLLAGLLGSMLSHLIPATIFESETNITLILMAAFFGVLLPIPIAFDVILVNAFYAQGMSEPIVLVLLCSLGIISIFSFMVIWSSVSKQWAISILLFCFSLSVLVGVSADGLHQKFYVQLKLDEFKQQSFLPQELSVDNFEYQIEKHVYKSFELTPYTQFDNAVVSSAAFFPKQTNIVDGFERLEGPELGLVKGFQYDIRDYTDPFWVGRGTASGDYNNDGWQDVIFGSNQGFVLYQNIGGKFSLQKIPIKELKKYQVFAVAFVDMDNNGWLDIFFTTFSQGNFIVHNHGGQFNFNKPVSVPNQNGLLTVSPAFADFDGNGLLDIVNGNMALGVITGSHHLSAKRNNSLVFNGGGEFKDVPLESSSGETMSTLVSDINNDGLLDIYFANDFIVPDKILLGSGKGFSAVNGTSFIPYTPFFSMSADSGDIDNDLQLDLLTTGTTATAHHVGKANIDGVSPATYTAFKGNSDTCLVINDEKSRSHCLKVRESNYIDILDQKRNIDFEKCDQQDGETKRQSCLLSVMWHLVTQNPDIENCSSYFKNDARLQTACNTLKLQSKRYSQIDLRSAIPQDDKNRLYRFDEATKSTKTMLGFNHPGGWTWNSRIVDLDNDGYQDVFNVEGAVRKSGYGWNVFMKNKNGKDFEQKQFSKNLTSDFGLFSYTLIDMDNDGDLDIIGNSAEGPIQVYRNHTSLHHNSVAISLKDQLGNDNSIGAKIYIYYDNNRQHQMREIKASGGYMSFDPTIAYFGIGESEEINRIKIVWPNKKISNYEKNLPANRFYKLTRIK